MTFRMLSERQPKRPHCETEKPETIVDFMTDCWRERQPHELVHYRALNDDGEQVNGLLCSACGQPAEVWYDDVERWKEHAACCK